MKKIKWIVVLLMFIGTGVQAQQKQKTPAEQAKDLQAQLKLTDDQTAKVTAVYTDLEKQAKNDEAKLKAWKEKKDMKNLSGYMVKQLDDTKAKVVPILTAPQKTKYEEMVGKTRQMLVTLASMQQ